MDEAEKVSISDALGETAPTPEPEKGETVETKEADVSEETEAPKDDAKGETPSPDETKDATDPAEKAFRSAMLDERKKRQALEQRLSQIEQEKTQAAKPDPFEDPEGHEQWKDAQIDNKVWKAKCDVSEAAARNQYGDEDFDKAYDAFLEEANSNPAVAQGVSTAKSPAHYAYDIGLKAIQKAEMGDPATYAERMRQEGYEKAMKELGTSVDEKVKEALAKVLPKSLADEASQGDRGTGPAHDGPTPLDQLIG